MGKNKQVFQGEFYTPESLAKEANKVITSSFGEDWREKYVVWDCAAGHGVLTKGWKLNKLYQSTLEQSNIDDMVESDINPEATKFQFDFLNDGLDKIPSSLIEEFKNKKDILFFINPPYAKGKGRIDNTKDVAKNMVNHQMVAQELGKSCAQLYCQFLYRIIALKKEFDVNVKLAVFSPPLFLTSLSQTKFRELFYGSFKYNTGFLCNSTEFGCREAWGIAFTVWDSGQNDVTDLDLEVVKSLSDGSVEKIQDKTLYCVSRPESGNAWAKRHAKKVKNLDTPRLRNPITVVDDNKKNGKGCDRFLGFFCIHGNNVVYNEKDVHIMSATFNNPKSGIQIIPESFMDTCSFFMARKSIDRKWMNEKDEYLIPNIEHPDYEWWETNSLIYSCFNNGSNQSSLRDVAYKEKVWNVENEFFWLSVDEVRSMAEEVGYIEMLSDIEEFGQQDRYMHKQMVGRDFDLRFKDILDMINCLFKKSLASRRWYSKNNPQLHLDCWDAGYYQLKPFWKSEFPEEFEEIRKAYRSLSVSLASHVYEIGFLKR